MSGQARRRIRVVELYGGRCNCPGCPVTDPSIMDLDHVLGNGGFERAQSYPNQAWVYAQQYRPDIYQILCPNCHRSKTLGKPCMWHASLS